MLVELRWVELRFHVPLSIKQVILEMFFPASLLASTEETKPNTTKANIHREHKNTTTQSKHKLEMWANAQRDGHPAEYRWRPLFNAAVWLTPTARVPCSNAAKTRNPLKFAGVPQTPEPISAVSGPKFTILSGHVEEVLLFFSDCHALVPKI